MTTAVTRTDLHAHRFEGALSRLGRETAPRDNGRAFQVLEQLDRSPSVQDPRTDQQAATLLVSQLFVAPLLAEAREFPFGGEIGHGGRGEDVFGEQLDQRLADRIAARMPGLTTQLRARFSAQREHLRRSEEPVAEAAGPAVSWDRQVLRDATLLSPFSKEQD